MKVVFSAALVGVLTIMLPEMTNAQDVNYAALFNRCGPVDLVVAGTEDAENLNIVNRAETMAESRMRAARIYGEFNYPELLIAIDIDAGGEGEMTIYTYSLAFRKLLTDSYGAEMPGTIEEYGGYGAATYVDSEEVADDIISSVSEHLDRFILEYSAGQRRLLRIDRLQILSCVGRSPSAATPRLQATQFWYI